MFMSDANHFEINSLKVVINQIWFQTADLKNTGQVQQKSAHVPSSPECFQILGPQNSTLPCSYVPPDSTQSLQHHKYTDTYNSAGQWMQTRVFSEINDDVYDTTAYSTV